MMKLLLEQGAHVNLKDNNFGRTGIMYAFENGQKELVKYLFENRADLNLTDKNKMTVFDLAKNKNDPRIIELLGNLSESK